MPVDRPTVLGPRATRQVQEMYAHWARAHRNLPMQRRIQPVLRGGSVTFPALLYDKVSIELPDLSSDPLFDVDNCPGPDGVRYFGSYSFIEVEQSEDPDDPRWRPKSSGRFGVGGECDGAIDLNRTNANIHVERMIVEMHEGLVADCESSEDSSSSIDVVGVTVRGLSTRVRYWFWSGMNREDCANRWVIASAQGNDFP